MNADDFGFSKGVNLGIIEAYQKGIVTSATVMMNMPECAHALCLARDNPGLGIGIHLTATCGRPLGKNVDSLVNTAGFFHSQLEVIHQGKAEDIEREFQCQIERFLDTGQKPTHIDSHHHIHMNEKVLPSVLKMADCYNLAVRLGRARISHYPKYRHLLTTDYFTDAFYGAHLTIDSFLKILHEAENYDTVEVMCHPAFTDQVLLEQSRYNHQRKKELAILTDLRIIEKIKEKKIQMIHYGNLKEMGVM